jgi:hypothetical protein
VLATPKFVTLVYGDDNGGANPGAVATAQTGAQTSVEFLIRTDPDGLAPAAIGSSPTRNVVADAITKLVFLDPPFTFTTDSEAGPLQIQTQDQFDNPSPVSSNQQIDLSSTSVGGDFSLLGGGSFSSVSNITILDGQHTASFYYRDTVVGTPDITASANGQSWTDAVQGQTVDPGSITKLVFLTLAVPFTTDSETGPLQIQTQDQFDNPSPVSSNQQVDLSSTSVGGDFSLLGGGSFSSISSVLILNGQDNASFYYRDTAAGTPDITASANGQSWTDAVQGQNVDPGPETDIEIAPTDTTITAGDFMSFLIRVVDEFGNKTPLSEARWFVLSPSGGQFFDPGNHSVPLVTCLRVWRIRSWTTATPTSTAVLPT